MRLKKPKMHSRPPSLTLPWLVLYGFRSILYYVYHLHSSDDLSFSRTRRQDSCFPPSFLRDECQLMPAVNYWASMHTVPQFIQLGIRAQRRILLLAKNRTVLRIPSISVQGFMGYLKSRYSLLSGLGWYTCNSFHEWLEQWPL